jgi:glutamine synthetase
MEETKKLGYTMNVGTESEFFLFRRDEEGRPTTVTDDVTGYFDVEPDDGGIECRRAIIETLEERGFEIEASHHEVAEGQHEINFKYADAVTAADNTITYKWVVRSIAAEFGLAATFMPKPIFGINGSGMHTNQSLFNLDGTNAFYDANGPAVERDCLQIHRRDHEKRPWFCRHHQSAVNSYKRLVAGYEAPCISPGQPPTVPP